MTEIPAPTNNWDSTQLYAACSSSNPTDQENGYRALWPYLYRVAYHLAAQQPDASALAQDFAQTALIRIYNQLMHCQEPAAFRGWCRRIVSNIAIDDLRRRKRLQPLEDEKGGLETAVYHTTTPSPEKSALNKLTLESLRRLLAQAPISERSHRVVSGRYLDDLPDEQLAAHETELSGSEIRPSHIQVTRTKNMSKLRRWDLLQNFLSES
ncbi:MAG: RNA polymerase sigma factor [Chloroflexota bacterium]|nr:RNA polymerase sigma factor [Anaerolineales bacterium]